MTNHSVLPASGTTPLAPDKRSTYTVETVQRCTVIRGAMPIAHFVAISKAGSKTAVLCADLAARLDVDMVFGEPEDIALLAKSAPPRKLPPNALGLPDTAIAWLQQGERGNSSNAMFDAAFEGVFANHNNARVRADAPADPADFRRCRLLVECCPSVRAGFPRVAKLSLRWASVIAQWDLLCELMDAESPEWRSRIGRAPKTFKMLIELAASCDAAAARQSTGKKRGGR